jgi:hypothetical protein
VSRDADRPGLAQLLVIGLCLLVGVALAPHAGSIVAEVLGRASVLRSAQADCEAPREGTELVISVRVVAGRLRTTCMYLSGSSSATRRQVRIHEARQ